MSKEGQSLPLAHLSLVGVKRTVFAPSSSLITIFVILGFCIVHAVPAPGSSLHTRATHSNDSRTTGSGSWELPLT